MIEKLLGDVPKRVFVEEYYYHRPFASPGGAEAFARWGTWETVEEVLSRPDADVLVARKGELREGPDVPSYAEAKRLHDEGYTIVLRHAERHHAGLAELAAGFYEDFRAAVNVHVYCTPANQHGFGWHYDAEDVFILQTVGSKGFALRKNTVNPWPVLEALPKDMGVEREVMPLVKCKLAAGDWLYIPGGYWHAAEAQKEDSISLSVGLESPTALDVYDFVRRQLPASILWRQRLPVTGWASELGAEELAERYRSLLAELGADVAKMMRSEGLVQTFLAERLGQGGGDRARR